jgi:flagellar biosynthesis protein FlhF
MYTKTFEADSLDEALKKVKFELGPDAVILKTVTNSGLKGAIGKKKKIEITAAIPERVYEKKARVDNVLNDEQKQKFYQGSASDIASSIDQYNASRENPAYGGLGLNKVVNQTKSKIKSSLDDFLGEDDTNEYEESIEFAPTKRAPVKAKPAISQSIIDDEPYYQEMTPRVQTVQSYGSIQDEVSTPKKSQLIPNEEERLLKREVQLQQNRINELEKMIQDLSLTVNNKKNQEHTGLIALRGTLKSLEINDRFINYLVKRAVFELSPQDLENSDLVFDFALREIEASLNVEMPLFSRTDKIGQSVITVMLSEGACGQTSMVMKMAAMKKDCTVIQMGSLEGVSSSESLAAKMYKVNLVKVITLTELITECRRAYENQQSIFVDFRNIDKNTDETFKFIEGMKRAFSNVEILVNLSAIHSELYNRKILNKYTNIAHGLIVAHLDQCLNYGSLLNLHLNLSEKESSGNSAAKYRGRLPFKFFGTGPTVPDDIEPASAERIIAGMFQL